MGITSRTRHRLEELRIRPLIIECRGCGRAIDVSSVRIWRKFLCRECMQIMRLTYPLYKFHYTRRRHWVKMIVKVLVCILIALGSPLMAWNLVDQFGFPPSLSYGIMAPSGVVIAALLWFMRARTQDYRLIAAILLPMFAARRALIYLWAEAHNIPFPKFWSVVYINLIVAAFALSVSIWRRRRLQVL